jgi:hypothetical protein
MSEYWSAQICLNGHIINRTLETISNSCFCETCGEITICNCPKCEAQIRGLFKGGFEFSTDYTRPKFCYNCGKRYPWTEKQSIAAKKLIDFTDKLSDEEKEDLKKSIDSLVSEDTDSIVAQLKYKKYVSKAGVKFAKGIRDILVDVLSETVKKTIWE